MKAFTFCITFFLIVCYACTQKSTASEEWEALSGKFAINQDTLEITANLETNSMYFDIRVQNKQQWKSVFNDAAHVESTRNSEIFVFQDSSEYAFEDLVFTYSYRKDQWEVEDMVFENNRDNNLVTDLSGIYQRVD